MNIRQKIKFFENEVRGYIKLHNSLDFLVDFVESESEDIIAACSEYTTNRRISIFYISELINGLKNEKEVSKIAYHEALELVFLRLRYLAENRDIIVTKQEVDDEVHRIIRIFENIYFDKIYKNNKNK